MRPPRLRLSLAAPDWVRFAGPGWADRVMAAAVADRFHAKQGRSIARWALADDTGASLVVYLKRHYVLPRWRGLAAALFPGRGWSPGAAEWANLRWAAAAGLPVPRPVAAGEYVGPGRRLSGFLAVEELAGMRPLHEAVPLAAERLPPGEFLRWKRGLVGELARLARELHRRRAFHKDLYLCHFYVAEGDTRASPAGWAGRVAVIDFHRLGRHRLTWPWWAVKDLAQLLHSSAVPGVSARDRVRFWKLYRAGDWGPAVRPPRWLRVPIRWKWRLYERNHRRRAARGQRPG